MSTMIHSCTCVLRASLNHVRPCWDTLKFTIRRYFHTSAVNSEWIALQSGNLFSRYPLDGISGRCVQGMTAS